MQIDREALDDRLVELESELKALQFLRDIHYCQAEGFIEIDEEGRCYPGGTECPNGL